MSHAERQRGVSGSLSTRVIRKRDKASVGTGTLFSMALLILGPMGPIPASAAQCQQASCLVPVQGLAANP